MFRVSDNRLNTYAEQVQECGGWIPAQSQSATYRHQTASGARVAIEVIPGTYDYSISDDFHMLQMAIQERQIGESMLAMSGGEYLYMTTESDAARKIPIVEDDIVIGYAKGKYSGASDERSCSKFRDSVGHDLVTNRFICTFPMENNFTKCLLTYLQTIGERWIRRQSSRNTNGVIYPMDGEQAIQLGERLKDKMIAQLMLNNQEQLARNIIQGDTMSSDRKLTILEGALKQLFYVAQIGQSKESVQFTLQRVTTDMAIEIQMGAQLFRVDYDTNDATTVEALISKINNITVGGKYPMQATRVINSDDSLATDSFVITSTDASQPLPIDPLKVVWKTPSSMNPNAEVKADVLVDYSVVDKSLVLPYRANETSLNKIQNLLADWKKYVRYNETFQEVIGDVWIHISRELAVEWEEGFAMLQPNAVGLGQTSLDQTRAQSLSDKNVLQSLAAKLGVRGIHVDPYMTGDIWFGTPKENFIFGVNTGMNDNYINISIGGIGAHKTCSVTGQMKSIEGHLVVDSKAHYGVGFRRYAYVISNLSQDGDPLPVSFKPLDPDCFGRKPIESNVIVQAVAA